MAHLKTVALPRQVLDRLKDASEDSLPIWDDFQLRVTASTSPHLLQISEKDLLELAEELELDPVLLARGTVDYRALAAHQSGLVTALPERYSRGESRIRTSAHVLDFVEQRYGWRARARILRRAQITEAVLADPEMKVNIRFITDVRDELADLGLSDEEFLRMGHRSLLRNYHSPVGNRFREVRDARSLIELCFTEIVQVHYDRNSRYRLEYLDQDLAIVEIIPNAEICHELKSPRIGSRLTCLNRMGGFASLTGYRKLPFAQVRESRCIHRGDDRCRVEIDFTHAADSEKRLTRS